MASELKKAKDKAWKAFSKFIRLRDCLATTGTPDSGICITCPKEVEFKQAQAGHLVDGRGNSVLFDEEVVHLQCVGCNIFKKGNYAVYTIVMIKRVGLEKVEEFMARKYKTIQYKQFDYERIRKEYEDKYEALEASY